MLGREAAVVCVAKRPSERGVLNKQDEGLLSKPTPSSDIDRQLESICQSHLFGHFDPYFESCDILRQHLLRNSWQTWENEKSSLTYLTFQRPQWNPTATETKRKMSFVQEAWVAFFLTWSLTQLPTHFLEFYWFRMLSWIRNFLAANGNGYDNSRLSDDIHRGSRQIHDKWLRFTCPSCT